MHVTRVAVGRAKLVYVIAADKKIRYAEGRSRVVYIGTTKQGMPRVAQSAAYWTDTVLELHGVRAFNVHLVTCPPRQGVKVWLKLERALLLTFREMFGEVPHCNTHGKRMKVTNEFRYFRQHGLRILLDDLS